jgi:hypothetical protein
VSKVCKGSKKARGETGEGRERKNGEGEIRKEVKRKEGK